MTKLATVNGIQSNSTDMAALATNPDLWFEQKFEDHMKKYKENKTPSMAIVVTRGGVD